MYQSFVRGTLNKKRQSQYSERKAAREQERYQMQHNQAVKDFNEFSADQKNAMSAKNNFFGLAKNQNQQMMKNLQLNQPSVMKNSTGAGMLSNKAANNMASAQEDDKIAGGLSSQALMNAGKQVIIDRSNNGSINRIGGITGTSLSDANDGAPAIGKDASRQPPQQQSTGGGLKYINIQK